MGTTRTSDDLTARARIRDAALRLFTDQGFEATTIRGVAAEAGVSSGLVRHHFGSKEDLRTACDTYALETAVAVKEDVLAAGFQPEPAYLQSVYPRVLEMQRYLARSLVDGSPAAAALFDRMVDLTEEWLAAGRLPVTTADPRAFGAALVAMQTGLLMLHDHVSRALGADVLGAAGQVRLAKAVLDVYSQPLLTAEQAAHTRSAYDQLSAALGGGHQKGRP
jgi:AcrR family transcriptional regulator